MTITELPEYVKRADSLLYASERKALIDYLSGHPITGDIIEGTGGIQFFTFPNSGLKAVSPRFYLVRPSGEGKGKHVIPDTLFEDDALNSGMLISPIIDFFRFQFPEKALSVGII